MLNKIKYFLPALLWAVLIFYLSASSAVTKIEFNLLSADKIGHLAFYNVQVVLLIWAFLRIQSTNLLKPNLLLFCWVVAFAYGASLEGVQALLPYRSFDYADMIANGVGALIGVLFYRFIPDTFLFLK